MQRPGLDKRLPVQNDFLAAGAAHAVVHVHKGRRLHVRADEVLGQRIEALVGTFILQQLGNADFCANDEFPVRGFPGVVHDRRCGAHKVSQGGNLRTALRMDKQFCAGVLALDGEG